MPINYELSIPQNLNIEGIIPESIKGENRKKYYDRIVYFVHLILSRLNTKKVFDEYMDNGYVRLMKKYLRSVMGNQTDIIINRLQEYNVIMVDRDYEIGEYSMGYILTSKYIIAPIHKVPLISFKVMHIYRKMRTEHRKEQGKYESKMLNVLSQLNKPWKVDEQLAKKWIEEFESKFYHEVRTSTKIPKNKKEDIVIKYKQYYRYIEHLMGNINQGATEYVIDIKAGRLHTAFTSFPRPLKNFLTYDGQPLACIDIKNSQPFLFSYMTMARFWSTGTWKEGQEEFSLMRVGNEIHKQIMKENKESRATIIRMLKTSETIENSDSQQSNNLNVILSQEHNFLSYTLAGTLYEFIMDNFKDKYINGGIDRFGTRDNTKKEVMRIMYFDTKKARSPFYAPFHQFAKLFPLEAKIMRLIKSCGYKKFPVLLQKIESKLMLEKIGRWMPSEIPFLTIHDSLVIPADGDIPINASELICRQIEQYLGIRPRVSPPDVLTPDHGFQALNGYVKEKLTNLEIRFYNAKDITPEDMEGYGESDEV